MKVLISSVLLIHVASVLSVYIPKAELGDSKLEPWENIFSQHIPQFIKPLNLTTGELKLFTGYSFQLIKSKCPAVSQDRLALINKYITKLISRTNPVAGSSSPFKDLISSISTCTLHQMTEEEREQKEMSFFQFFFHPLRSFKHLFGWDSATPDYIVEPLEAFGVDPTTTAAPATAAPDTLSLDSKAESIQIMNLKDGEKVAPTLSKDDDDEGFAPVSQSSTVSPDQLSQKSKDADSSPFIRILYTSNVGDDSDDGLSPYNPVGWLSNILRVIQSLFSGMFGPVTGVSDEGTTTTPAAARAKRSADATLAPTQPSELIELKPVPVAAPVEAKTEPAVTQKDAPTNMAPLKGKEAFMVLMDNLCRIYCDQCMDRDQIVNFKAAAKELYQYILTDSTGIELAAKHFLEPEFLQTLNDC